MPTTSKVVPTGRLMNGEEMLTVTLDRELEATELHTIIDAAAEFGEYIRKNFSLLMHAAGKHYCVAFPAIFPAGFKTRARDFARRSPYGCTIGCSGSLQHSMGNKEMLFECYSTRGINSSPASPVRAF
jgi:hypothetical protein